MNGHARRAAGLRARRGDPRRHEPHRDQVQTDGREVAGVDAVLGGEADQNQALGERRGHRHPGGKGDQYHGEGEAAASSPVPLPPRRPRHGGQCTWEYRFGRFAGRRTA